jgi:Dolichyl-phosphate-mannose-protein mannosyltransferase
LKPTALPYGTVRLALACLLLAGALIRLPHLTAAPLEFHATRQYRSAVLARGYAATNLPGFTRQEREGAVEVAARMGPIEPPVFEHVAALLYRVAGREALWMPRFLGVLGWIAGAAALWWLVAPTLGALAGLAAVAVALFLPYGVPASQAFQPDGPMTALTVTALAAMFWRHSQPSSRAAAVAALCAALAIFIKPMAAFFVVPAEVALSTLRTGWLRGLRRSAVWAVAVAAPAVGWYVYVAMTSPSTFDDRVFPHLLTSSVFWTGWLGMADRVVPWPALVLAGIGVAAAGGATRRILLAVWMGYLAYGMVFAYHIHTHDYYSLPLIPLAGWSIGALVSAVEERLDPAVARLAPALALGLVVIAVGPAWRTRPYPPDPDSAAEVERYEHIGQVVGHSARVVSLDGNYGFPLSYHGRLVASNLPLSIDAAKSALAGRGGAAPEALLASMAGEFFVATSQAELDAQPRLRAVLEERYPVVDRGGTPDRWQYVVYDLRRTHMSLRPARSSVVARVGDSAVAATRLSLWAEPGARWRATVSLPTVLALAPAAGVGPATLVLTPRTTGEALDQVVEVSAFGDGQATAAAAVSVRVSILPAGPARPPFGFVDAPPEPVTIDRAPVVFQGWALDDLAVSRIWVGVLDNAGAVVSLGDAQRGGMRPDVAAAYPNAHDLNHSAWAFALDPDVALKYPQPVTVVFFADDADGLRVELGRRTVHVKR